MRKFLGKLGKALLGPLHREISEDLDHRASKEAQLLLYHSYREMAARGGALPRFADVGFRCHSQFEEDGILLFIFALIGTTNKVALEICAGDGTECMSANLILNHGWWGHLFDGSARNGRPVMVSSPTPSKADTASLASRTRPLAWSTTSIGSGLR